MGKRATISKNEETGGSSTENDDLPLDVLRLLCEWHSVPFSKEKALHGLPLESGKLSLQLFSRSAEKLGIETEFVKKRPSKVPSVVHPFVVFLKDGRAGLAYRASERKKVIEVRFTDGITEEFSLAELDKKSTSTVIYATASSHDINRIHNSNVGDTDHWLWGSVTKFWPSWLYLVLAALIVNILGLALPLFIMNVYDRVIPYSSFSTLWALVAGVSLALFVEFILRVMRSSLISNASRRIDMSVSSKLFEQAMDAKLSQRNFGSGELASQIREFESIRDFFTSSGVIAVIDLIFIGIFLTALWWIVSELALVPLIAVPIVLIVTLLLQLPLARAVRKSQSAATGRHSILVEALNGIETVKSIVAEGVMQRRWEDAVGRNVRASSSIGIWSSIAMFFTAYVQQAVSVILVTWGVFLIVDGKITIGALIASNILAGRMLAPIGGIANTLVRLQQSVGAFKALNRFMSLERDHQPEIGNRLEPGKGNIEFRDVGFAYPNDSKLALDGVSLRITPGERVAILGKVGSGKSSLGKLLNGLHEANSGAVILDDTDTRRYPKADLRAEIGYVGQETDLFTGTLKDNILIANPQTDKFDDAVRISGTLSIAQSHPLGFEMPVGERGKAMSGGQRQSVAIARALTCDHRILFLDEPTSQMDTMSESVFVTALLNWLPADKTLIISTHRSSLLKLVNRIILLDQGKVIADGPKEEVLKKMGAANNASSNRRAK